MGKFSVGNLVCPGTRVGPAEDPKVGFYLLVGAFCFAIGLRVIGGGKGEVIIEEFSKFLSEGRGKLQATI